MAEQSLAAMPIKDGALYYIYPAHSSNAQLESFQIQNLENVGLIIKYYAIIIIQIIGETIELKLILNLNLVMDTI